MKSKTKFDTVIELSYCRFGLQFENNQLRASEYLTLKQALVQSQDRYITDAVSQLQAYLKNPAHCFDINLKTGGTVFQQKVWKVLTEIPAGEVMTYGDVAKKLKSSAQAVGNACRANPIPLIIPCHRVVAANGLGGFAGQTSGWLTDIKRELLRHEGLEI